MWRVVIMSGSQVKSHPSLLILYLSNKLLMSYFISTDCWCYCFTLASASPFVASPLPAMIKIFVALTKVCCKIVYLLSLWDPSKVLINSNWFRSSSAGDGKEAGWKVHAVDAFSCYFPFCFCKFLRSRLLYRIYI